MNRAQSPSAFAALELPFALFLGHQRFEQPLALIFSAQAVDVLTRDRRKDDPLSFFVHFDLNASPFFYSKLTPQRGGDDDLTLDCSMCLHNITSSHSLTLASE